jgi:hypothetical protein
MRTTLAMPSLTFLTSSLLAVGRVLRLFSNQSFFALYDKAGEK